MGLPAPIGLVYPTLNPFDNHQVLVYGYKDNGDQTGSLYVYDNNAPGVEFVIDLNLQGNALVTTRDDCRVHASPEPGPLQGSSAAPTRRKLHPSQWSLRRGWTPPRPAAAWADARTRSPSRPRTLATTLRRRLCFRSPPPRVIRLARRRLRRSRRAATAQWSIPLRSRDTGEARPSPLRRASPRTFFSPDRQDASAFLQSGACPRRRHCPSGSQNLRRRSPGGADKCGRAAAEMDRRHLAFEEAGLFPTNGRPRRGFRSGALTARPSLI